MSKMRRNRASEVEYTNMDMEELIDNLIHSERDRKIMKRRLIDGICYEPLAEESGLSVQRVKTIVYKYQDKLFLHLK